MHAYVYPDEHFKTTLGRDVFGMLVGDRIGTGTTREVYCHALHADCVVKIENGAQSFFNVYEHQIWERVKDTDLADWFAPVLHISPSGTVLIMRRTEPVREQDLPDRVPAFFTDLKAENFGWLEGRIVCHDYGHHRFIERGMTRKMRKASWRSAETLA